MSTPPAPSLLMRPYLLNPRRGGGVGAGLRALLILPLWLALLIAPLRALGWYAEWCERVAEPPDITAHPEHGRGTRVLSSEGVRLGGFVRGHRPWTPAHRIPNVLISAFVAAEDGDFFLHDGVDPRALLRAALVNLEHGRVKQGGSTITQQVAKMYVGRERTLERKIREAFVARRIEQRYTKLQILEAYLNRIYLGAGAHGVAAAAEIYFDTPLAELGLTRSALLAGLVSAPSRLNPFHNPSGARARRHYVLTRMRALGFIDDAAFERADAAPLGLQRALPDDTRAPYVVDEARRRLRDAELPGDRPLTVETTASLPLQAHAVSSLTEGARALARFRQDAVLLGALAPREIPAFLRDTRTLYGRHIEAGRAVLGVVTEVGDTHARVQTGDATLIVTAESLRWLLITPEQKSRRSPPRRPPPLPPLHEHLPTGALVLARPAAPALPGLPVPAALLPNPHELQGALVAFDVDSGATRALVGGAGHDVSQFNRATRGCRQPGSVFKPVLYSKGFERGMTPASMIGDTPVRYEDREGRLIWEPRNADRDFKGPLMLADALAASRNLPSVKLLHEIGATSIVEHAHSLGIHSPLKPTPALALGASCVSPEEMTRVFGVFARRGYRMRSHLIRSVLDDQGRLLLERGSFAEPAGPVDARLLRLIRALAEPEPRPLRESVAYLTTYLLRQVVLEGTAKDARALPVPVAGKTGTTNSFDVWFMGFSRHHVTGVWLGDDRNRAPLGDEATGSADALPVWLRYMTYATRGAPADDPLHDPPESVELHRIDPGSGLKAHPRGPGQWMPFLRGTAPRTVAPSPTERSAAEADVLDHTF